MNSITVTGMLALQAAFWGVMLVLLVYLIVRRIRIRRREDFERRDN